jgi:hypothetical protein
MDAIPAVFPDSHAAPALPLRELYYACLGGDGKSMEPAMALALCANFGSVERWREEFAALGEGHAGGTGWALLVFQPREGTLVNRWATDHAHAPDDDVPILALDIHARSRPSDVGAAAGAHVADLVNGIDWAKVYERYQAAVHDAGEPFGAAPNELADVLLLDVRRAGVYEQASDDSGRELARPCPCRRVARQPSRRPRGDRLLRLWSRSGASHHAETSRCRAAGALPARGHRRLAGRRTAAQREGRGRIMKWITRERPKIDRIACPWLIQRFIDRDAEFLYVPGTRC